MMMDAAIATCDFYIRESPTDGVPYWDTGAPGLVQMPDCLERPSDPYNNFEPVDSSAAAIATQALLRMSEVLKGRDTSRGEAYRQAGCAVLATLLSEPYLSVAEEHEGLLLHSVYHRPRGWDQSGENGVPCGESTMWGDYHLLEAALLAKRMEEGKYYTFFEGES